MQFGGRGLMYGLIPLYGVEPQPTNYAKMAGKNLAREDLPDDVNADILGACVMGDPEGDAHLSVEVEVAFPDADSEADLPDREDLFPRADGVSYLAISEVED